MKDSEIEIHLWNSRHSLKSLLLFSLIFYRMGFLISLTCDKIIQEYMTYNSVFKVFWRRWFQQRKEGVIKQRVVINFSYYQILFQNKWFWKVVTEKEIESMIAPCSPSLINFHWNGSWFLNARIDFKSKLCWHLILHQQAKIANQ